MNSLFTIWCQLIIHNFHLKIFAEYFGISAIQNRPKSMIEGSFELDNIENELVDKVKKEPTYCNYFYNFFLCVYWQTYMYDYYGN